MFTLGQIGAFIIAAVGLTLTVLNVLDKIAIMKERADKPMIEVVEKVKALEEWKSKVDSRLEEGDSHFNDIDASNRAIQKALLALMDSSIDGNNIDELKKARKDLYNFMADHH
jgi:endonuclease V-like protein UPF0215 family